MLASNGRSTTPFVHGGVRVKLPSLFLAAALASGVNAAPPDRFEEKLPNDLAIRQAINRLTFGARPGDFERVRSMGLQQWIELHVHPESIPQTPVLDEKLKPLATLHLSSE